MNNAKISTIRAWLQYFIVATDHRPLLSISDKKRFDEIDIPSSTIKRKNLRFNFFMEWIKDSEHSIPEAFVCYLTHCISQIKRLKGNYSDTAGDSIT